MRAPSRVGTFAAQVVESSWLTALAIVPVFFNRYSERIFEEDKALLLRSIGLVGCAALIIWGIEQGRDGCALAARRVWRAPLVRPALLLTAAYCVSTVFSVAPAVSFWGAYIRCQGTYTWLIYMAIFFAVLFLMRQRDQVERAVTVGVLASAPMVVYALIQHCGGDPVPWAGRVTERVASTAGNAIFLSAFMVMVIPLTLVRAIEHCARLWDGAADAPRRLPSIILAAAYVSLLVLQLLTIVYSQSRGPFIGLGVALPLFFVVLAARYRLRRLVLATAGAAVAGLLFLIVLNMRDSPLEPLHHVPYIGHLGHVFETNAGTGKVRVLIWQGATALLAADPVRDLVGYGPETLSLVYGRFYPAELGDYESRSALPDRAHNETFDALCMLGVVGFVAQLSMFLCFFYYVLRWLGMIRTQGQRNAFVAATVAGGMLGGIVPYLIEGQFRLSGVGLPVGIACALLIYLIALALRQSDSACGLARSDSLLLLGLFTAVVAHFVEIHFGIAVVATRLYFWMYAGLAVVVGAPLMSERRAASVPGGVTEAQSAGAEAVDTCPEVTGGLLGLSPVMGLMLAALAFGFYVPEFGRGLDAVVLLVIFPSTWLCGAIVIAAAAAAESRVDGDWPRYLSGYATTSLGVWMLFLAAHVMWTGWLPGGDRLSLAVATVLGSRLGNTVSLFYAFVLVALLSTAALAYLRDPPPLESPIGGWRGGVALYPLLLAGAVVLATVTNLNPSRADTFSKLASSYAKNMHWEPARGLYEEAQRRAPWVERYAISIAHVLMEAGRTTVDVSQRDAYFGDALRVIERSRQQDPLIADHVRNRARLYRLWASLSTDPTLQADRYAQAEAAYQEAMRLSPNHAGIMNEWATLYLDRNQPDKAFAKLAASLAIDDQYATTYWLRANAYVDAGNLEAALEDYERAIDIDDTQAGAWSGRALVLARLNRLPEAIEAAEQAVMSKPNNAIGHRNLALLYRQAGRFDLAIAQAQTALGVATDETVRTALTGLIEQLNEERAAQSAHGGS